jgi:hypothetical protein
MKTKTATLLLLIFMVVSLSVSLTTSQVTAKSNVWGYVRDADTSKPINGALFEAVPQEQGASAAQAYTNDQGYFELTATPGKAYRFKASANGYLSKETGNITMPTDRDLLFDNFLLQKAPTQGFTVQALVSNQAVTAGEKATYTLVLIAAPQFSGTVSIGIRSSIASTGYQILPDNNVPLSSQSNSTISVIVSTERETTQPGLYNFVVTATSGNLTQTALMMLTVYAAPQTLQEQIMAATVSAAPLIVVCAISVVVGFLIGRRRSKFSKLDG